MAQTAVRAAIKRLSDSLTPAEDLILFLWPAADRAAFRSGGSCHHMAANRTNIDGFLRKSFHIRGLRQECCMYLFRHSRACIRLFRQRTAMIFGITGQHPVKILVFKILSGYIFLD